MKKQKTSVICVGIAVISILTAVGITFYSNVTWYAERAQDAASENEAAYTRAELEAMEMHNQAMNEMEQESLSVYEEFGLSYDSKEDQIYLNGSPIRYFEDNIADDGSFMGTQLWCKSGTGGAYVVHNEKDEIQEIQKYTEEELEKHLKKGWKGKGSSLFSF